MAISNANSTERVKKLISGVRLWTRGKVRAPHKPLLLLLALGRVQRGEPRLVPFVEIEEKLAKLLQRYGPTRASHHPAYPFWRLQNDGVWDVKTESSMRSRLSNSDPPVSELRRAKASGGFNKGVDDLLRNDRSFVALLARATLEAHFSDTMWNNILEDVGLDLGDRPRSRRDPHFRDVVLGAWGYQCAVCGFDSLLDGSSVALEAAHVHWFCSGGPSTLDNGLCLCVLHHETLDLGLWGLDASSRIVISTRLHGGAPVRNLLGRFHGKRLRSKGHGRPALAEARVAWHTEFVFKNPL